MSAVAVPRWAPLLWLTLLSTAGTAITAPGLTGVVAGAAALLVSVILALKAAIGVPAPVGRAVPAALRDWSRRTGVLRQRDPDAAGRPRPRAPSPVPLAV